MDSLAISHPYHKAQPLRDLNDDEKQLLISTFYYVDEHGAGYLSREDIKVAIVFLCGYKPSKYELNEMLSTIQESELDENNEGVSLEKFIQIMKPKIMALDEDYEIRQTFLALDTKCRGFIGLEDLQASISTVAPHLSRYVLESHFREMDRDGDGRVSYRDFEYMMKYGSENGL